MEKRRARRASSVLAAHRACAPRIERARRASNALVPHAPRRPLGPARRQSGPSLRRGRRAGGSPRRGARPQSRASWCARIGRALWLKHCADRSRGRRRCTRDGRWLDRGSCRDSLERAGGNLGAHFAQRLPMILLVAVARGDGREASSVCGDAILRAAVRKAIDRPAERRAGRRLFERLVCLAPRGRVNLQVLALFGAVACDAMSCNSEQSQAQCLRCEAVAGTMRSRMSERFGASSACHVLRVSTHTHIPILHWESQSA